MCEITSPSRTACTANPGGFGRELELACAKVQSPLHIRARNSQYRPAGQLPDDRATEMAGDDRRTWPCPSMTSPSNRRLVSANPISSHAGISVRSGGWCSAISVGCSGDAASTPSNPRLLASSAPAILPGTRAVKDHESAAARDPPSNTQARDRRLAGQSDDATLGGHRDCRAARRPAREAAPAVAAPARTRHRRRGRRDRR